MKIIFLDIDGVLNFAGTEAKAPSGVIGIVDKLVKNLKSIIDATGAKVVLTSTWKNEWNKFDENCSPDGTYLVNKLKRRGIHILDKTSEPVPKFRGTGIRNWLSKNTHTEQWLILDDDMFDEYYEEDLRKHLVLTDNQTGLTEELIDKCVNILEGDI